MDIALWLELIAFVILMTLSGFFSSSETALFSLNPLQIEQMRRDENPKVNLIKRMLAEPRRLIVTILIGNEFANVAASVISAALVINMLGAESKYINLFIMVPILLLMGEITPKTLALRNNVAFASFQSRPIQLFAKTITPLRWIIRVIADWITTLIIGKERARGSIVTQDMMRTLAHEAEIEGVLTHHEARFIDHIFDFSKKSVAEVMTPRSAIFYLSADLLLTEIVSELNRTRHARVPIYKDNRDNVIGILYARDLLKIDLQAAINEGRSVTELLREPFLVPEVKPAEEMFETFRKRNLSVALTVDEFGGITGLVTMADLLEHIFGHIRTLSDAARMQGIEQGDKGRYIVEGDIGIVEFNQEMNTKLYGDHASTIAGLVLNIYGELPPKGSFVEVDGIRFTVAEIDRHRIAKLAFEFLHPAEVTETEETQDTDALTTKASEQTTQISDPPDTNSGKMPANGE